MVRARFQTWALQNPWQAAAVLAAELFVVTALIPVLRLSTAIVASLVYGGVVGAYLNAKREGSQDLQHTVMWLAAGALVLLAATVVLQAHS